MYAACGVEMTDEATIAVYNTQAAQYADLVQRVEPHPTLLDFMANLQANDWVLDLGCGPAQASAQMRDHGLRVDPVDASEQMVEMANKAFDIGARQALFDDIDSQDEYDGIWANFSLLHASAEEFPVLLVALHRALKPTGILHLGMKLGSGCVRDRLDRFYSYYTQEELIEHLCRAGFEANKVTLGEDKGLAGDIEPWIAVLSSLKNP